jgi:hypothetical protein
MAPTPAEQKRTAYGRQRIAALALAALVSGVCAASAQTALVPMPNLSPLEATAGAAAAATTQAAPDLQGANSPFADTGAGLPDDALPLVAEPESAPPATPPAAGDTVGQAATPDDQWSGGDDVPLDEGAAAPTLTPDVGPPSDIRPGTFTLEARLAAGDPPLGDGVKWRIFGDTPGTDGHLPLLGEADGGVIYIRLDPGAYYVHAAYGRAGTTRKIVVDLPTGGQVLVLNAGGMRLTAINGADQTLEQGDVAFDIYAPDEGGSEERYLLIPNAPPGHVISLNAGTYHVVCKYGDANAIVRADVKIDPGRLTEATVFQKAARLTLKLVEAHGGEAIADTAWSVVTQAGGDSVLESVGAFPSVVLAAGDYTAVAKHDGRTFQANFSVVPGLNRDIEVLAE